MTTHPDHRKHLGFRYVTTFKTQNDCIAILYCAAPAHALITEKPSSFCYFQGHFAKMASEIAINERFYIVFTSQYAGRQNVVSPLVSLGSSQSPQEHAPTPQ